MKYTALVAMLAFAQADLERVFHFTNTSAPQSLQEIATIVRSIAGIRELKANASEKSITFSAPQGEAAVADYLMVNLDQKKVPAPLHTELDGPDKMIKIFSLRNTTGAQSLQEVATVVRTITELRYFFVYTTEAMMVTRGMPEQVLVADWLIAQLDKTSGKGSVELAVPGAGDDFVRVFYVGHSQPLHQLAVKVRTMAGIRLLFTYDTRGIIAARGTAAQLAQAEQIISQ